MREFGNEIDAGFSTLYGDKILTGVERMNLRYDVAKLQLGSKSPSFVEELEKRALAEHKLAVKEWQMLLQDIDSAEDIAQYALPSSHVYIYINFRFSRTRDNLFEAVHPLLQAIGGYAGCYVSLIAGCPPGDDEEGFFTA
jgi:hypothetical protein